MSFRLLFAIAALSSIATCVTNAFCHKVSNNRFRAYPWRSAYQTSRISSAINSESPRSRIQGNQREPTIAEIATMDEMITKMADAKPYELPSAVSKAIRVVTSPRFFLRIAERVDIETSPIMKEKLSTLAENLATTIEAVVDTAEERLQERAEEVEKVLKAAAEPDSGEFLVPLTPERTAAMRAVVEGMKSENLDEGFLSTVDAWMNKSSQDGMDGMVSILQQLLQMYAGTEIARTGLNAGVASAVTGIEIKDEDMPGISPILQKILKTDCDRWDIELAAAFRDGDVSYDSLVAEVQSIIEVVVLGLENGSMKQRVQAEYMKELLTRMEKVKDGLNM